MSGRRRGPLKRGGCVHHAVGGGRDDGLEGVGVVVGNVLASS